ncbi:MAG: hypothetical protein HY814_11950 [Candidatus Riflebacteria bacterium]|nr:hypothetical protein [Candidatus Riflebacteria bacterium]
MSANLLRAMKAAGMQQSRADACARALALDPEDEPIVASRVRDEMTR